MIQYKKYILKSITKAIPMCDECLVELVNTNIELLTHPPLNVYVCPKCNKQYNIGVEDVSDKYEYEYIGDVNNE